MKKIKILYLVSTLEAKGPTNQLFYIIKYLDRSTFEPLVLTLSPEPKDSLKPLFDALAIPVQTLGTGRISGLFKNSKIIKALVQSFKPDIIQSMGLRADGYNELLPSNFKKITTSRNFPLEDYPSKFGKIKGYLMAKKHLKSFEALQVISCSYSISRQLNSVGISTQTIQNGVDFEKFSPAILSEDNNHKIQVKKFVTIGSLIPRKDVATIIYAFNLLGSDFHLTIVGDGPLREELQRLVTGNNISFMGQLSDVLPFLHQSVAFISASKSEGLPNAVLEAMATDLPVILSDIPSHRELVIGTVFQDLLFPLEDSKSLKEILSVFDPYSSNYQGARAWVMENFSAEKMSQRYQKYYLKEIL